MDKEGKEQEPLEDDEERKVNHETYHEKKVLRL